MLQVASQFNALESVSPKLNPLRFYPFDRTQGPRCVMPCANALLRRHVSGFDAFSHIFPDARIRERFVKHGFVQYGDRPDKLLEALRDAGDGAVKRLLLLPQWTRAELVKPSASASSAPSSSGAADGAAAFIQVFSAAPPTNHQGNSGPREQQKQIALELVVPQYRALAQLAVIRSRLISTSRRNDQLVLSCL